MNKEKQENREKRGQGLRSIAFAAGAVALGLVVLALSSGLGGLNETPAGRTVILVLGAVYILALAAFVVRSAVMEYRKQKRLTPLIIFYIAGIAVFAFLLVWILTH